MPGGFLYGLIINDNTIMAKLKQFELSDKQIAACKEIEHAFKKAKKAGIVFLAKGDSIEAYKPVALKNAAPLAIFDGLDDMDKPDLKNPIPCYSMRRCICDSGADDTEYFKKGIIDD